MGIRRGTAVSLAALGALAAGSSVVAATAWAAPPLQVEVGQVQCLRIDLPFISKLVEPAVLQHAQPTVQLTMSSTAKDGQEVGYSVTVNGTQRASGSVTGEGPSINVISLDRGVDSRLVVTSGDAVVVDRVLPGRC
ncbi:hypothetical protein [Saccharopolyspora hordei]|uniref:Uncharacterized protein n=1 Tax=Saccharopolyspora hordei TaxID=1838 RepID=A0A853AEW7_9PSEU|nr:hypothetical protein [Saccharopolyspora hordei]NYI82685.1 hypothetical protein [Saccharopolyspora hordei]